MKRAQRHLEILRILEETGHVQITEIRDQLGVSAATARRDLDDLAADSLLTRTHGGAVGTSVAYQLPSYGQVPKTAAEKREIALAASAMVRQGATIALTGGTTSTVVAAVLAARSDLLTDRNQPGLTVITNAINIAAVLAMRPHIRIVMTGGVVRENSYHLVGSFTDTVIDNVLVDLAFIDVDSVCSIRGPMVDDPNEAGVIARIVSRARRVAVVADSTKLGQHSLVRVGRIDRFTLITDAGITDKQHRKFVDAGVTVVAPSIASERAAS